ncbi:MAG: hypothetical protein GXP08_13345 [Gammaproteobacteria bacterium]|nr:hypothetical protein [Gammaproteobacteria bacterium]
MLKLATAFLLLSGLASLTYQVVWVRLLGLSMGSTSASISIVLAAFFLGLALGSYLAERLIKNRFNILNVYIVLEVIIGLSGLVLLPILLNLDLFMSAFSQWGSLLEFKFIVTMALLIVPTMCMGATFPVMASILVRKNAEIGLRVSQLYSFNTGGAVLGAVLAGFVFVPNWGLDGAVYIAVLINASIVVMAIYAKKIIKSPSEEMGHGASEETFPVSGNSANEAAPLRMQALLVLFATGFVAIATEVGWTKYLSIFTGTTIYGFAAILAIFLFGIAIGSWVIRSRLDHIKQPEYWMAIGLVLLGVSLLFARGMLSFLPAFYESINHFPADAWLRHAMKYTIVFFMLIVPTVLFGALFPLNLKLYCGNLTGVRARIGKAYAINTVASILGSVVAGFWIIPVYGTNVLLTGVAIAILLLSIVFIRPVVGLVARFTIVVFALLGFSANWYFPTIDFKSLIASVQYQHDDFGNRIKNPEVLFVKEGKAGVISLVSYGDRYINLQNNGLNESGFDMEDDMHVPLPEYLLGLIPYFLHESPKSAFIVGFGGGYTTSALSLTEELEKIKVVELEPAVIAAGEFMAGGLMPVLQNPKVNLEFNDARNTLLLDDSKYDIIASQPSHPWLSRASTVFTKEFFEIVDSRLADGGIYGQWLSLFHMDATTLRAIIQAFYGVFPHGVTFADVGSGDFLLFGSANKLVFDYEQINKRMNDTRLKKILSHNGLSTPEELFRYFALSREQALEAAGNVRPNTDINILSEVRLSLLDESGKGEENPYSLLWEHYNLNIIPYLNRGIPEKLFSLAHHFYGWDQDEIAGHLGEHLKGIDATKAKAIEIEGLYRMLDYEAAEVIYKSQVIWPDRTHWQYAEMMMTLQRFNEASSAINRIDDLPMRYHIWAKMLFMQTRWVELAALKPQSEGEQLWQLTGAARTNIRRAGKAMSELLGSAEIEAPQLQVLAQYYASINDGRRLNLLSRKLVSYIDGQVTRLVSVAQQAINAKAEGRARRVIEKISQLNPQAYDLEKLTQQVDALGEA